MGVMALPIKLFIPARRLSAGSLRECCVKVEGEKTFNER
jgi:hypothetical protein